MLLLRIILIPFSILYCGIILLRNKFYDWKIFRSKKISKPVISIGNITTGGTGKTPFTIYTAKYFLEKGKTVGIVSRGFGRSSDEIVIVSDGNVIENDADKSGDELQVIARELLKYFPGKFSVAAGSDKAAAAETLIDKFNPDIIILDDSFQHRQLYRDLDVVIVDAGDSISNRFLNSFTLPSGKLRESYSGLSRADIIIQNNKSGEYGIIDMLKKYSSSIPVMRYKTEYIMDYKNRILEDLSNKTVVFSGIADDSSFIDLVKTSGIKIDEIKKFPDHHDYTVNDLKDISAGHEKDKIFITTEKDFVKLLKFENFINQYPVYYLKLKTEITGNDTGLKSAFDALMR